MKYSHWEERNQMLLWRIPPDRMSNGKRGYYFRKRESWNVWHLFQAHGHVDLTITNQISFICILKAIITLQVSYVKNMSACQVSENFQQHTTMFNTGSMASSSYIDYCHKIELSNPKMGTIHYKQNKGNIFHKWSQDDGWHITQVNLTSIIHLGTIKNNLLND